MANGQDGTIYPEGQPFPMDPLLGINPVGQAASATQEQIPGFVRAGETALGAIRAMQNPNIPGGGMVVGPQLPKPVMPQAPSHGSAVGIPQGPFGTVGERKRADKQALFSSIGSLVNQARDRLYEKKVQNIQRDLDRLGQAMQGYKEGQATGNKAQMDQNAGIINEMLHDDPKKAKELSKVFDVNLNPFADKKGKDKPNEYTDAGKRWLAQSAQAKQNFPGLSPQAAMFMQRMPQTLQMDPAMAMRAQMVKDKLIPSADATMTAMGKIADSIISGQSRMDVARTNRASAMIMKAAIMGYGRMQMMGKLGAKDAEHLYKMQEIYYKHVLAMQDPNPQHRAAAMKDIGKNIDDAIGTVKYDVDGVTIKEATGIKGQIAQNEKEIKALQDQKDKWFSGLTDLQKYDMQGKINALQESNERLKMSMKALMTERIANAQAIQSVGGSGATGQIPTPEQFESGQSSDSSGAKPGDDDGGGDDSDVDEPDEPDEGLNNLERFFPGLTR